MSESLSPSVVTEPIVTTPAHVAKAESPAEVMTEVAPPAPEAQVTETPVAPVEAAETPPAEAPAPKETKLHTDVKSLLEESDNVADKASEDGAKAEGTPERPEAQPEVKPEVVQPPQPEAPLVYEMKLPEGFGTHEEQLNGYTEVLREHRIAPEIGQRLLDMHAAHVQQLQENTLAAQHEAFAATRAEWRDQIKSDPMLGGAGFETVKRAVSRARDLVVPETDRAAFNEFLTVTGAGDHPAFWRALYRVANLYDEPAAPPMTARPTPDANPTPRRGVMGLFDKKASNSFTSR